MRRANIRFRRSIKVDSQIPQTPHLRIRPHLVHPHAPRALHVRCPHIDIKHNTWQSTHSPIPPRFKFLWAMVWRSSDEAHCALKGQTFEDDWNAWCGKSIAARIFLSTIWNYPSHGLSEPWLKASLMGVFTGYRSIMQCPLKKAELPVPEETILQQITDELSQCNSYRCTT